MTTIAYVGNFGPPHSTENHVAETLRRMGHVVVQLQEDDPATWAERGGLVDMDDAHSMALRGEWPDLVLWTRTGSLSPRPEIQQAMLESCRNVGVPTVGFHLDRWWGLDREGQVHDQPWFRCDLVCTADGGHDQQWADAGVNHLWLPPAVAEFECGWGTPRREFECDVAFVGSWAHYHPEWSWRRRLVRLLQGRYGNRRFRVWPEPGQEAVRGVALRDLYASATVVVGDSCLVPAADGSPIQRYWSDRIPETLGRGGLLVHPWVHGMGESFAGLERGGNEYGDPFWTVEPENIEAMFDTIEQALALPLDRQYEIRRAGMMMTMQRHTYRHRMERLLDEVHDQGLIR